MGLYVRGNRYYYKKQIEGKVYYQALYLRKGQERLLSARLAQVEEEIIAKHFGLPYKQFKSTLFTDYVSEYLKQKEHKRTVKLDEQRLDKVCELWGTLRLEQIGKPQVKQLEGWLLTQMKPSTLNRYFEILRGLFNMAIEDNYLRDNPIRFYIRYVEDGQRQALTGEEVKKILAAAHQVQQDPRSQLQSIFYDIIILAINTGMRLSEILKLKKSYINDGVIYYPVTETKSQRRALTQNKKFQPIVLNEMAAEVIARQDSPDDYVFPMEWRDPKAIRRTVARIRKLSKVSTFTFHQIRHTVSTYLSAQVSLATAKAILGHSSLETTLKYTHPEIEEQRRGVTILGTYVSTLVSESPDNK